MQTAGDGLTAQQRIADAHWRAETLPHMLEQRIERRLLAIQAESQKPRPDLKWIRVVLPRAIQADELTLMQRDLGGL